MPRARRRSGEPSAMLDGMPGPSSDADFRRSTGDSDTTRTCGSTVEKASTQERRATVDATHHGSRRVSVLASWSAAADQRTGSGKADGLLDLGGRWVPDFVALDADAA